MLYFGHGNRRPRPTVYGVLKDFGLERLDADQRVALRAYLTHFSRKWAEMDACQATEALKDDFAATFKKSRGYVPNDFSIGFSKDVRASLAAQHERALKARDAYGAKLIRREGSVTKDVDLEFLDVDRRAEALARMKARAWESPANNVTPIREK